MSQRYSGPEGSAYWERQRGTGQLGATFNAPLFAPYVGPGDRLLDFGCGGGFLLYALPAKEKIGIEPNAAARRHAESLGLQVLRSCRSVPTDWADVVICNHALEHSRSPYDALRHMLRILRPGGILVMHLPLDDWRNHRNLRRVDLDGHFYAWAPTHIRNLAEDAGFTIIGVEVVARFWPPGVEWLQRSPKLVEAVSWLWGVLRRRRELHVVAVAG